MTDRYNALTVVLEQDIRDDDAEYLINAIRMLRGVLDVQGNVSSADSFVAQSRADREWREKIRKLIWPDEDQ
jgi:hypothetical protein